MATTSNTFTGNGSTTNYSFTFEYLEQDEVKVTLDGTATTAFTFANATTLSFTSAPANNVEIRIYRDTDTDTLKATFFPGSAVKAEDLNDNFTQNNFAVQEIKAATWDTETETIKSNETWVSSDSQIATTAAMDARFQDEATETIESTETWVSDDDRVPTTLATDNRVDAKIDAAITGDIATDGTGITITNDGDGSITLGLGTGSVDFDRIKDADIITYAEQNAGSPSPADTNIFTASAAARRFDTIVQTTTPSGSDWEVGKTWLQNDADKTLSVWDGNSWEGISSGGTFTSQLQVVYVDAASGNDSNDGHRISRPKATIKAAVNQINADATYGDGSVVVVAPGVYQEAAPIQIQKKNVSIIGTALRSCIVHPTVATQGDHADGNHALFELNSGSFIQNLTLTGMKAGTYDSGDPNTLDSALPKRQGWNFAFFADATITKSPYIQNCTNFSDSEIDNSNINVNTPAGGAAGDTDSAPTGGGMLVNGDTVHDDSPLRSMVADSYTHVGLNGPGILVTNNGYTQCTSSYAFFNRYHIKALNGGQANLAASTTDFGDEALVADGKSTTAIFTSTVDGAAADGDTTFNIDAPTAGTGWFGDAQRPASNMLVTVNSITYPVLSAAANGSGWTVTVSRPNANKRSENLGLNGAIADGAAVSFFLRSMIASSGHTMEYVGSGTNYNALPENGGVPNAAKQIVESNDGKIWTAITDHNGRFAIGDFFTVDQRTGSIEFSGGSVAFDVVTDETPELGGELDALTNKIVNLGTPTAAADAATKGYVDGLSFANYSDTTANFTGTLQNGGSNVVVDSDIGSTVQAYDAGLEYLNGLNFTDEASFKTGVNLEIGVDVQAFDADTAKYDDTTANFTGTLQNGGSNVVVDTDIGSTVQAFDADTTKNDVANTFTAEQTFNAGLSVDGAYEQTAEAVSALDIDLSTGNYFTKTISANSTFTFSNPPSSGTVGSFTLELTHTSGTVTWPTSVKFPADTAPTLTTGKTHIFVFVTDDGGTRYRGAALADYVN